MRSQSARTCASSPRARAPWPRYDGLGRDAGIDGKTAKNYLDVLERLFLVRVRRPWHTNLGKRQVKAPKLYIADPGLMASTVGADPLRVKNDDGPRGCAL